MPGDEFEEQGELTTEERRAVEAARAGGLSLAQAVEAARTERGEKGSQGGGKAQGELTRAEVEQLLEKRERQADLQRAKAEKITQMQQHVSARIEQDERVKGKELRRRMLAGEVMNRIPQTPEVVQAKTEGEFYAALDKLAETTIGEYVGESEQAESEQKEAELDQHLDAERDAGTPSGGPTVGAAGDGIATPKADDDPAHNPVYGLGVEQPTDIDFEKWYRKDIAAFGRKHGVAVRG